MFSNLKRVREELELSQRMIADILGISKSSYNYYETGEYIISLKNLNNFCNCFHVSMDYVTGLSDLKKDDKTEIVLNLKTIGLRLKKLRLKLNMTQKQMASYLNTSQSNISAYENGKTIILTAFAYTLAKDFNISLDYLCGRTDRLSIKRKND